MKPNVQMFVEKWQHLLNFVEIKPVDTKKFKQLHDEYAKRFSKQTVEEQGAICDQIFVLMKNKNDC